MGKKTEKREIKGTLLNLAVAILRVKEANMREIINNAIKPLSLEKEMLTHNLNINLIKNNTTPFFKFPCITNSITILLFNFLCQNKQKISKMKKMGMTQMVQSSDFYYPENQGKLQRGCVQHQKL